MTAGFSSLFENTVLSYLRSSPGAESVELLRRGFDFAVRTRSGELILIEAKSTRRLRPDAFNRMVVSLRNDNRAADRFLLVTPEEPTEQEIHAFRSEFSRTAISSNWVSIQRLPEELGAPSPGDLTEPRTLAALQLRSIVKNLERYSESHIGTNIYDSTSGQDPASDPQMSSPVLGLSRQFSLGAISGLTTGSNTLEEGLRIAQRVPEVTVVLTDIINFSSLVGVSRPEDIQEAMGRYYRLARSAVFEHGGMLDKFIGDAVLAVFGYPTPGPSDSISALKFARQLVEIGKEVLPGWVDELNHNVATGTRVGIATGDIWPINIGESELEIALLGDTINLAARLEQQCAADELLIDNRTKQKARREDPAFVESLNFSEVELEPGNAKGQPQPVRAWATHS